MNILDAHIHLTPDGRWFHTSLDASLKTALRQMDKAGIEMACVIPLPGPEQRGFVRRLVREHSDRFHTGFTVTSLEAEELTELKTWLGEGGARMVKVHPRQTGISPLNPGLEPFLKEAEAAGVPVVFDTYVRGPRLALEELSPFNYDKLAREMPNLTIILAHAGGHMVLDALAVAQSHPNVFLEISHVLGYYQGSSVERDLLFAMTRMDRKLIYGSDFPEYPIDLYYQSAREMVERLSNFNLEGFFGGLWRCLTTRPKRGRVCPGMS